MTELEILKQELEELKEWKKSLEMSWSIPLNIDQSFRVRFLSNAVTSLDILTVPQGGTGVATLTGVLIGNGTSVFTAEPPIVGTKTYYVSDTSGGITNRKLTIKNGIITSDT